LAGVALANWVVYEICGFRWSLCGIAAAILLAICLAVVWWIFQNGLSAQAIVGRFRSGRLPQ
jgi:hypothetical protein